MPVPDLHFPAVREAPPEVLAALRTVDERAVLPYMGEGKWWLGYIDTSAYTVRHGQKRMLAVQAEPKLRKDASPKVRRDREWRYAEALLRCQGFVPTRVFEMRDPHCGIAEEFRAMRYAYQNSTPYDHWRMLHDLDPDARDDSAPPDWLMDRARYREAARILRNPVSVTVNR